MNLRDFKFWLEGYCEQIGDPPTRKEWKLIKEKIASINDQPLNVMSPLPVTINPKMPSLQPSWPIITCNDSSTGGTITSGFAQMSSNGSAE